MEWKVIVSLVLFCSMFPRSTHDTFAQKLYQTFKDHKRFSKPKLSRTDFTICHYAGDVSTLIIDVLFARGSSEACLNFSIDKLVSFSVNSVVVNFILGYVPN